MKTSEILSRLTKIKNEIIFKLCANAIIAVLLNTVLANKFIEYFNEVTAIFFFSAIVGSFIWIVYFTVSSINKYNKEYEFLIRKLS